MWFSKNGGELLNLKSKRAFTGDEPALFQVELF